ncbi:hypothetical protein [Planctomyces sp. SH-PL62]|uniref:hypothetical protein n=1 Tax=Planctomyces sp. SH-PL62 TaxID=1636152 RepID=UPI00078D3D83|nr:hypothetical protein [Planctomyces sp. SH-PL62]AMV41030.1 hypothetical protein VT85_26580 [Planctomyces sp. SH-PL62]
MHLEPEDQEYLRAELLAFLDRLGDPEARRPYDPLPAAVEAAEVPDDLLEPLGRVLDLSLSSGRLRRLHGPAAEMSANRLFRRTPQGRAIRETLDEANLALTGLRGQSIRSIDFAPRSPGTLTLSIETDRCRARFVVDAAGVRCQGVELDL